MIWVSADLIHPWVEGGAGGCIACAPGNQPTEMLVHFFNESGIETGINEKKIYSLKEMIQRELYDKIPLVHGRVQ